MYMYTLIIIIASVRTADTNLRLAIPMIHLRRTNVISRDRHVIIIPDLTLPRQRGAIQVHHPFCWSHTVDLVLQRGFPPPLPPALLFQAICADLYSR